MTRRSINNARVVSVQEYNGTRVSCVSLHSITVESSKVKLPNNKPDQDEYLPIK